MAFSNDSALWNDIQSKGILTFQQLSLIQFNISNSLSPPPSQTTTTAAAAAAAAAATVTNQNSTNLTQMYMQSPNKSNVSRKLFQDSTTNVR